MADTDGPENAAPAPENETPQAEPASAPEPVQPDPLEVARKEAADFKNRLLHALADMENLRKRTEREVADARVYGMSGFARDMLNVADNMRRALDHIAPELRANPDMNAFVEGVELTEREMLNALEKNGVRRFDPQGEKFDPHVHQAMFEVPDASVPSGHVAQVVQAGFMIGERVLRPALVGVSKGAAKKEPTAGEANGNSQ